MLPRASSAILILILIIKLHAQPLCLINVWVTSQLRQQVSHVCLFYNFIKKILILLILGCSVYDRAVVYKLEKASGTGKYGFIFVEQILF